MFNPLKLTASVQVEQELWRGSDPGTFEIAVALSAEMLHALAKRSFPIEYAWRHSGVFW